MSEPSETFAIAEDDAETEFVERREKLFGFFDPLERARRQREAEEQGLPDPTVPLSRVSERQEAEARGGVVPSLFEVGQQIVGGSRDFFANAAQSIADLNVALGNLAPASVEGDLPADPIEAFGRGVTVDDILPQIGPPETTGGALVRGAAQFLTGFIPFMRALKIPGIIVRGATAGAITDFLAFDPDAPRISNLLHQLSPALRNPITEYLAAPERGEGEESRLEGRLKNTIEGLIIGSLGDALFHSVRTLRQAARIKRVAQKVAQAEAAAAAKATRLKAAKAEKAADVAAGEGAEQIADMSRQFQARIQTQRRGERPIAQAVEEANRTFQGTMTIEDIQAITPGTTMNDAQAIGLIQTLSDRAEGLRGTARGFLEGKISREQLLQEVYVFSQIDPVRLGVEAEGGRTLRVLGDPIVGQRKFIQQFSEALQSAESGVTDRRLAEMFASTQSLEQMRNAAKMLAQPGWWDLFMEVRVHGLLSSPRTYIANVLGNTAALSETIVERAVAPLFGRGEIAHGEAHAMLHGIFTSIGDAWRLAAKSWRGELDEVAEMGLTKLEIRENVFTKEFFQATGQLGQALDYIGNAVRVPGRALIAADDFFKTIAFRAELHATARREAMHAARSLGLEGIELAGKVRELERILIANPPAKIKAAAKNFAQYVTFTERLEGAIGGAIQQFASTPVGRFIVPFTRTPTNIAKFSIERTPFAVTLPRIRRALRAGGADRALALAKISTGSSIMGFFGLLAYNGIVTGGGPQEPNLRRTLRLTGWQPYSIKVTAPDGTVHYIGYNRLEPISSIIGMAADFVEISGELEEFDLDMLATAMVGSIYKNLGSKTFLRGIADAVDAIADPDRELLPALQSAIGSVAPFGTLVRHVKQALDPEMQDARGLLDRLRLAVPGFGPDAPPRLDLFGDPMLLPPGLGSGILGDLLGAFIPIPVTTGKADPVADELSRVRYPTTPIPRSFARGVPLTPEQRHRWASLAGKERIGGRTLKEDLADLFKTDAYRRAGEEPGGLKHALIQRVISTHREVAKSILAQEFPELEIQREEQRTSPTQAPRQLGVAR